MNTNCFGQRIRGAGTVGRPLPHLFGIEMVRPGPRALRAETGLMIFYLRFLTALSAGRWVVTRELYIVVTCKCVVY